MNRGLTENVGAAERQEGKNRRGKSTPVSRSHVGVPDGPELVQRG